MKTNMNGLATRSGGRDWRWLTDAMWWLGITIMVAGAACAGRAAAEHMGRVAAHETALLVIERDVRVLHQVLREAGYITEAGEASAAHGAGGGK